MILSMKRRIRLCVFCALCAVAGMSFGGVVAGAALSDFGDARWLWPTELGVATNTVVEFRQVSYNSNGLPTSYIIFAGSESFLRNITM